MDRVAGRWVVLVRWRGTIAVQCKAGLLGVCWRRAKLLELWGHILDALHDRAQESSNVQVDGGVRGITPDCIKRDHLLRVEEVFKDVDGVNS